MTRYAQPRQLQTRRGESKTENNAWCLIHRKPMERHGLNFTCPGHWSTRITSSDGQRFVKRSLETTGWTTRHEGTKYTYPWCVRCHKRMLRLRGAKKFKCFYCKDVAGSRCAPRRFESSERQAQVKQMIQDGFINRHIVQRLHVHHSTVARLRLEVTDIALCQCGKIKHHNGGCEKKRDIRSILAEQRTEFDRTVQHLSRAIPGGLPAEVREDIAQEMFVDIRASIDQVMKRAPEYLRRNNKWYNRLAPFDFELLKEVPG